MHRSSRVACIRLLLLLQCGVSHCRVCCVCCYKGAAAVAPLPCLAARVQLPTHAERTTLHVSSSCCWSQCLRLLGCMLLLLCCRFQVT
jgi:hypothetical protein